MGFDCVSLKSLDRLLPKREAVGQRAQEQESCNDHAWFGDGDDLGAREAAFERGGEADDDEGLGRLERVNRSGRDNATAVTVAIEAL